MRAKHVIVINVACLAPRHMEQKELTPNIQGLLKRGFYAPMRPSFPPVTCSVQASIATGTYPNEHGIIANGLYDRDSYEVRFWEQSCNLVLREQIWSLIKRKNPELRTAVLFWQNSMYINSDVIITPRPLHLESGMVQWCYSKPVGYYEEIAEKQGRFDLMSYWGPFASAKSSEWIVNAAIYTLRKFRPNLMMIYIPHLDYSTQKFGINTEVERKDLRQVDELIGKLLGAIEDLKLTDEAAVIVLSEYSMTNVNGAVPLNVILRDGGLLSVRTIEGKEYIDLELSKAFAMVDHQIAHVYVKSGYRKDVRDLLEKAEGVRHILGEDEKRQHRIDHERSGEIVAIADEDRWFAYYWWKDLAMAPEFARTVDIHRKPGYDPLDLFLEPGTGMISVDTSLIKGSHGFPPYDGKHMASFLISGQMIDVSRRPDQVDVIEVAPTIASLLGIDHRFQASALL